MVYKLHNSSKSILPPGLHLINPEVSFKLLLWDLPKSILPLLSSPFVLAHDVSSLWTESNNEMNLWMHSGRPSGTASSWTHYRRSMQLSVPADGTQSGQSSCLFWKLGGGRACHDDPRPVAALTICRCTQCVLTKREIQWPLDGHLAADGIMQIALLSREYGQCR